MNCALMETCCCTAQQINLVLIVQSPIRRLGLAAYVIDNIVDEVSSRDADQVNSHAKSADQWSKLSMGSNDRVLCASMSASHFGFLQMATLLGELEDYVYGQKQHARFRAKRR